MVAVCVVVGGFACAKVDIDDRIEAGPKQDAVAASLDGGVPNGPGCTASEDVQLDWQPADVLILLDRSGSMDTAFGSKIGRASCRERV